MQIVRKISFSLLLVCSFAAAGLMVVICNEAVAFWHARQNTNGATVLGFALYETELPSPAIAGKTRKYIAIPNSRVVGFYQHKLVCEFTRERRESRWKDERQRILNIEQKTSQSDAPLPLNRYHCGLFPMFYRAGVGWGLF